MLRPGPSNTSIASSLSPSEAGGLQTISMTWLPELGRRVGAVGGRSREFDHDASNRTSIVSSVAPCADEGATAGRGKEAPPQFDSIEGLTRPSMHADKTP